MHLTWLTRRRVLTVIVVALLAAIAWTAWLSFKTAQDLRTAQASVDSLQTSLDTDDQALRTQAINDLQEAAASAHDRTSGAWWSLMTHAPVLGDDAAGVSALSEALDLVASDAVAPLGTVLDSMDELVRNGRIDLGRIEELRAPVRRANAALARAKDLVNAQDSSGFVERLQTPYDDFSSKLGELASMMSTVSMTVDLAPPMLGSDGPRNYLLVFENNAEIRATGGLPGSWAEIRADNGRLKLRRQGAAADFPGRAEPIGDLTDQEVAVFGKEMGRFFQDPNFTPDFPRAARIFDAFWETKYKNASLDGVVAIDVVGLSYLLNDVGPINVDGAALNADNVVDELLSRVYTQLDPEAQDLYFQSAARAVFGAVTSGVSSPRALVRGLGKAASEGRLLVAPFDADEARALAGTRVGGALSSDDGATPHVDVAVNSASSSKMSYYLRYTNEVVATACHDGVQSLSGTMNLYQTISAQEARTLPEYVAGVGGAAPAGAQLVRVHLIGPFGGVVHDVRINGRVTNLGPEQMLDGRPVRTVAVQLDSTDEVVVTWSMSTGVGQVDPTRFSATPSIAPGDERQVISTVCY